MSLLRCVSVFLVSLAMSVDDMAVGVSYGLRGARIPPGHMAAIITGSTVSMFLAMLLGKGILNLIGQGATKYLSMILLFGLGLWTLYQAWRKISAPAVSDTERTLPGDRVSLWESLYLGLALGIDDFAEAVGLSLAGFPIALTVLFFKISEVIAIYGGYYLSLRHLAKRLTGRLAYLPGVMLLLVGLWQIF